MKDFHFDMKLGDKALLIRGKKRTQVKVMHDHTQDDPPFPAVTIKMGEKPGEWIVGRHELLSPEEIKAEEDAHRKRAEDSLQDIVNAFNAGNISVIAIARHLNKQVCEVVSRARKAERMGLIKLVKPQ